MRLYHNCCVFFKQDKIYRRTWDVAPNEEDMALVGNIGLSWVSNLVCFHGWCKLRFFRVGTISRFNRSELVHMYTIAIFVFLAD